MTTRLPHLTDNFHFAIANVAARASQLEHNIEETVAAALPANTAEFVLKNFSMDRVVGLLENALLDAYPKDRQSIKGLITKINELRNERNQILHWSWLPGSQPETGLSQSARPFREVQHKEYHSRDVQHVADEMLRICGNLQAWQHALR